MGFENVEFTPEQKRVFDLGDEMIDLAKEEGKFREDLAAMGRGRLSKKAINEISNRHSDVTLEKIEAEKKAKELERITDIDTLTGLLNRKGLLKEGYKLIGRLARGEDFSVLVIDIDDFKLVNDTYGHLEGDRVLKRIGRIINNSIRVQDSASRPGGEEFVVLLAKCDHNGANELAERIRTQIEKEDFGLEGNRKVTVSIGVEDTSKFDRDDARKNKTILFGNIARNADKAMYVSKREGKNRVTVFEEKMFGEDAGK